MTEDSHASLDLLDRAVAQTSEIVAAVDAKEASLPTPCHSWDVGHLVSHVVHGFGKFAEMADLVRHAAAGRGVTLLHPVDGPVEHLRRD